MDDFIPEGYTHALEICGGLAAKLLRAALTCSSCADFKTRKCKNREASDPVCGDYAGKMGPWP